MDALISPPVVVSATAIVSLLETSIRPKSLPNSSLHAFLNSLQGSLKRRHDLFGRRSCAFPESRTRLLEKKPQNAVNLGFRKALHKGNRRCYLQPMTDLVWTCNFPSKFSPLTGTESAQVRSLCRAVQARRVPLLNQINNANACRHVALPYSAMLRLVNSSSNHCYPAST